MPARYYDLVFSLGRFCHTKTLLEGTGLSKETGPWDWSGTPVVDGIYKRLSMIADGFDDFFNKEDFVELATCAEYAMKYWEIYRHSLNKDWPCLCLFNYRTYSWYVHDGTNAENLNDQFDDLKRKYMRRAERFMRQFQNAESILAVYISNAVDQKVDLPLDLERVAQLLNKVRNRHPAKRIDLAVFTHDASKGEGDIASEYAHSGITVFKSNHHICPDEPWLVMRGYKMPKGIAETLLSKFRLSERISQ